MAPTAVRVMKKEDYEAKLSKKYDTSSIDGYCVGGEKCDADTVHWITKATPSATVVDNWW